MKIHPKRDDKGRPVTIKNPHDPTPLENWADAAAIAVVVPEGAMPAKVGDVPISPWIAEEADSASWEKRVERAKFEEPPFEPALCLKAAAGVVTIEPDGRVWVVAPSNAFGGYEATFPKGTVDPGASLRTTAVREAYEEAGLLVELQAFLIDVPRSMSYTRYYIAKRVGGDPSQMGWESQAVKLVPHTRIDEVLNNANDKPILDALAKHLAFLPDDS